MNTEPEPIGVTESLQRIYDRFGPKNLQVRVPAEAENTTQLGRPDRESQLSGEAQGGIETEVQKPPLAACNSFPTSGLELRPPEFDPALYGDSVHITVIRDQHTKQPSKSTDTAICVEVDVEVKEFHRGTNPHAFDPQRQDGHEVVLGEAIVSENALGYNVDYGWPFVVFWRNQPIELTKGELNEAEQKAIEESG